MSDEWPKLFGPDDDIPEEFYESEEVQLFETDRDGTLYTVAQHRTKSPAAFIRVHGISRDEIDDNLCYRVNEAIFERLRDHAVAEVGWYSDSEIVDTNEVPCADHAQTLYRTLNWIASEIGTLAADREDKQLQELFDQLDETLTEIEEAIDDEGGSE